MRFCEKLCVAEKYLGCAGMRPYVGEPGGGIFVAVNGSIRLLYGREPLPVRGSTHPSGHLIRHYGSSRPFGLQFAFT